MERHKIFENQSVDSHVEERGEHQSETRPSVPEPDISSDYSAVEFTPENMEMTEVIKKLQTLTREHAEERAKMLSRILESRGSL